jgi:hypothetical protein
MNNMQSTKGKIYNKYAMRMNKHTESIKKDELYTLKAV